MEIGRLEEDGDGGWDRAACKFLGSSEELIVLCIVGSKSGFGGGRFGRTCTGVSSVDALLGEEGMGSLDGGADLEFGGVPGGVA